MKVKYSRSRHNAKQTSFTSPTGARRQCGEQGHAQYCTNHDVTSRWSCRRPENVSILIVPSCLLEGGLRLKNPSNHSCCWKWTFPRAMSKIPSSSRRRDTAPGHGALAPRSNFPRPRVAQSIKKTPQQTFPVVIQILSILKFFVYCCHSDIDFTKNCILTNFIS